jgi:hypothetical protein
MLRFIISCIILVIVLSSLAAAGVPQVITYQGRSTNDDGTPVADGKYQVQFRIWTTPAGIGFVLWNSGPQIIDVENGLFSYLLGSAVPLPDNLFSVDTARWLGMTLADDPETEPRFKITSAAYSYHSLTSDTAEFSRAASIGVIRESNTISGTTEMIGPDAGTIVITFDSTFTQVPIVYVTVVTRVACGMLEPRNVPHWTMSTSETECVIKVFEYAGGSTLNGCSVDVSYLALQIGP